MCPIQTRYYYYREELRVELTFRCMQCPRFVTLFPFLLAEPLGSGPVIGVVVLILIILVIVGVAFYSRSKGILCFSGKSHCNQRLMHVLWFACR